MAVRVKICGITRLQDLQHACVAGADAVGFVFYEKSPRHVAVEAAAELVRALPPFVQSVGLFVNAKPAFVESLLQRAPSTCCNSTATRRQPTAHASADPISRRYG